MPVLRVALAHAFGALLHIWRGLVGLGPRDLTL
jgi:hypothetical protein